MGKYRMDLTNAKILVVDDEPDILEFVSYNLKNEGCIVYTSNNGDDAILQATRINPHLILLDVMMPVMDGIETCERIRENPLLNNTMIVFLTARSEDYSQIAGFEAGGDDYIKKPVKPKVLISRMKALLKRYGNRYSNEPENNLISFDDLVIDEDRYLVFLNKNEIVLPRKEFKLLTLLASKPSKVFTRDEIFNFLWGTNVFVGDRTIDVYIRKLRDKLGDKRIVTIKGVGYKFES